MIAKKAIIVTLAILMLVFSGCGASDKKDTSATGTPSVSAGSEKKAASETPTPSWKEPSAKSPMPSGSASAAAGGSVTPEEQQYIDSFIRVEAPDFTLEDKDGNKVTLSALKGTPVVLNFWATWCPYCVGEFKIFTQAQKNFPQIKFFGIDTNEEKDMDDKNNRKANEDFARGEGFELPVLFDVSGEVFDGKYAMQGLPSTFFIDKDGFVRVGFSGAVPDYKTLETLLNAFLKAK